MPLSSVKYSRHCYVFVSNYIVSQLFNISWPYSVPALLQALHSKGLLSSLQPHYGGGTIMPILQLSKLRIREVVQGSHNKKGKERGF